MTGCASNLIPSNDIYTTGGTVALMWEAPEHARTYDIEQGGLLGALAGAALASKVHKYVAELKTITVDPVAQDHYLAPYSKALTDRGMQTNLIKLAVDHKELREKGKKDRAQSPYDFSFLKEENVDYVMFLSVNTFGIQRHTGMGVSAFKPQPKAGFKLFLIDTSDNSIVGRYKFKKLNLLSENWKANDFEIYKKEIKGVLIEGLEEAYFAFFEG